MDSIIDWVDFVNSQRDRVARIIEKHPEDRRAEGTLRPIINRFNQLVSYLETGAARSIKLNEACLRLEAENLAHREHISALKDELSKRSSCLENLDLKPSDLADLPPELLAELSLGESDYQEFQILELIDDAGGAMTLDQLLIGLWRKTKEVNERGKLNAKLYRMAAKGMLYPVPGKKATYTIYQPGQEDFDLFEGDEEK